MAAQLSRAYWWVLGLALLLALVVVLGSPLVNYLIPNRTGMDQTAKDTQVPEGKQAMGAATVKTKESDNYGVYLTDGFGHPLYLFKGDKQGRANEPAVSTCYGECATVWPPLIASDQPKATDQVQADRLSSFQRKDGSKQVTYNGWPLYRYAKDSGPDQPTGQDVKDFDAEWYLVTPSGEEVHASSDQGKPQPRSERQ